MDERGVSNYESTVGKRWGYYRPRFERFAAGGWLSWNWAAFFGTLAWLRYRGLHAWSWAYFFISTPFLLALMLVAMSASDACERALAEATGSLAGLVMAALLVLGWFVPPLFANRLYFAHVRSLAERPGAKSGTGRIAGALALQAFVLLGAAIAAPGYGNYLYRARVSEGVALAAAARGAIEAYVKEHQRLPARIEEVVGNTSGRYVERIALDPDGTVRAIFGEKGGKLAGRSVEFAPQKKDGEIAGWTCLSRDLPQRCLPAACRQ